MCGIAGILDFDGKPVDATEISRLTSLLAHRGPFGEGVWSSRDRRMVFGHRRLAIIDPTAGGHQPMLSGDHQHVIVFNGEIYNFLELRRELETLGFAFRSQSDTEVILAAWRQWGEAMLPRFNGMWALAIYDNETGELFLARDRFGIKPLLYAVSTTRFIFASEQRALVQSGLISPVLDIDVARRLLIDAFGIEGSERTLFRNVLRLQAGHCMRVRGAEVQLRRWWRTTDHLPTIPATERERVDRFRDLFENSVALRMRSDVPIGSCLSGGFDSSAIVCSMAAHERAGLGPRDSSSWRHAFVATFPGAQNDERPMAEQAAAWAGVNPIFLRIGESDALADLERVLDDIDDVYIGAPTAVWQTYRELKRHNLTVSLDGHGADELMGAYLQEGQLASFRVRNFLERMASTSQWSRDAMDLSRIMLIARRGHYFLRGGISGVPRPFELVAENDRLPPEWGALNRRLYRMFHSTVLPTILRNFDRLSMAHGIEVRMPFMDWRLVTYTMALADGEKSAQGYTKFIARRAMAGAMPDAIRMGRRKVGFNSPMPEWLNGPLTDWTRHILASRVEPFSDLVDEAKLRATVERLTVSKTWSWERVGRIWPYLNMKWMMARYA